MTLTGLRAAYLPFDTFDEPNELVDPNVHIIDAGGVLTLFVENRDSVFEEGFGDHFELELSRETAAALAVAILDAIEFADVN